MLPFCGEYSREFFSAVRGMIRLQPDWILQPVASIYDIRAVDNIGKREQIVSSNVEEEWTDL